METRKPQIGHAVVVALLALALICLAASPALAARTTHPKADHAAQRGKHLDPRPHRRRPHTQRSIYWGAWIGDQLTGEEPPWDMTAVTQFQQRSARASPWSSSPPRSPTAPLLPAPSTASPAPGWRRSATTARSPSSAGARQSIAVRDITQPDFQLADVIAGTYDSYIREFAEAAATGATPSSSASTGR